MDTAAETAPARERGWSGPIAALLGMLLLAAQAGLGVLVPVGDVLLLLAPVTAACAIAGWRAGGRLPLAVIWTAFAAWVLWAGSGIADVPMDLLREWAVLLAVLFGLIAGARVAEGFLSNALLALAAAALIGSAVVLALPGGMAGAVELVTADIGQRVTTAIHELHERMATPEWAELVKRSPGWGAIGQVAEQQVGEFPAIALRFFPALLALQSLAVMALGWAVYHRVGRARLGPPLARLRDLRFHEALVWGVVTGLALVALPFTGMVHGIGVNLLAFFGVLYVLRGVGVVLSFLSPGRTMAVLLVLVIVVLWQDIALYVLVVSAGLGLGDTWFDWRRLSRPRSQRSE